MPVARVVIPGLEGPDDHDALRARAARAQAAWGDGDEGLRVRRARRCARRMPPAGDIAVLPPVAQGDVYRVAQKPAAARSASSTATSRACPRSGTRRSSGRWPRASTCSAAPAWARCAPPSCTRSACAGVGRIFEAYRDGELEDDDEVAVIHGPAETGYVALSEAMVNIRRTLGRGRAAAASSALRRAPPWSGSPRSCSITTAPSSSCSSAPPGCRCAPEEIEALRAWLPQGRVDQKREDALAMLGRDAGAARGRARAHAGRLRPRVDRGVGRRDGGCGGVEAAGAGGSAAWLTDDRVLEELRLEADTYLAVRERALLRLLAGREAARRRQTVEAARGATCSVACAPATACSPAPTSIAGSRRTRSTASDWSGWSRTRRSSRRSARSRRPACGTPARRAAPARRLHPLRRARPQQAGAARGAGLDHPSADDAHLAPPAALRAWYFEQRLGRPLPDDIDAAARELGFADRADFDRALRREWLYCSAPGLVLRTSPVSGRGDHFRRMRGPCR